MLVSQTSQKKTILWCDDEDFILSSVRRLLRNSDFELTTETNPEVALKLIENNFYSVIVSDQRMPEMTGIELLSRAKVKSPYSTRIMVTGFLDQDLLSEALNKAGVFRFINKPWEDLALVNDLQKAYDHSQKLYEREMLRKQITQQNQSLSNLNEGLETVVSERTRSLEESRNELRFQETRIKDLIQFIENLNNVETAQDVLTLVSDELKSVAALGAISLFVSNRNEQQSFYYSQGKKIAKKFIDDDWESPSSVRQNDIQDQKFLIKHLGRPVSKVVALPLQRHRGEEIQHRTTVFAEFFCESSELDSKMEMILERLQPVGIAIDRVLLTETLNKSSRQWEKTFDNIEEPIAIIDRDYGLLRSNKHFKLLKNQKHCFEAFAGSTEPCSGCPLKESLASGKAHKSIVKSHNRTFEVQSFPLKTDDVHEPTTVITTYTDITEDQKLYGHLIQSEKMAALGELAGNIAHEINNPLTGIQALTQILIAQTDNENLKSDLSEIHAAAIRSQNIIKNFQEFSSDTGEKKVEWLSLNDIVQKTLPLLKTITRDLENHLYTDDANPQILANQHLLQQVVFNLVTNAAHAMPDGGKLEISVFHNTDKKGFIVKDTGPGIPADIQNEIFEPFFTTKKEGVGTGLGLSVCRNIVREFGGEIVLKSTVGVGSEFRIEFPEGKYEAKNPNR